MAAHRLTTEQRAVLDTLVADAVEAGHHVLDGVAEKTRSLLTATRLPWGVVFARDRFFKRYVKNALLRLKDEGRIQHGRKGRTAWWTAASLNAYQRQVAADVTSQDPIYVTQEQPYGDERKGTP